MSKSRFTLALVLFAAVSFAAHAQPVTIAVGSGLTANISGGRDTGTTFGDPSQPAYVVTPHPAYASALAGTSWISISPDKSVPNPNADATFRYTATFTLPPGYGRASPLTVQVHADNAATLYLNGTQFGAQPQPDDGANFQDPAESYSASPSLLHAGLNVLEIDVVNFGCSCGDAGANPMALDYLATMTYEPPIAASIDIKPGSALNPINLGAKGTTPVAILSSATFDAATVDPATVKLAGAPAKKSSREDVNGDGYLDLVLHVDTAAMQLDAGSTEALLEGKTFGGASVRGVDSVRIVK